MKFLFDLLPVIFFFTTYKLADIYWATGVAIGATCLQIAWVWFRHGKVDTMLWASLGIVTVFGGATLLLHDETFIKWKPTVLYWLFAAVLGGAQFSGRNVIRQMLEKEVQLPDLIWGRLSLAWIAFFLTMGCVNLLVAFNFPTDTWVNFKLFGGMGLMLVFILAQGVYLSRHMPEEKS